MSSISGNNANKLNEPLLTRTDRGATSRTHKGKPSQKPIPSETGSWFSRSSILKTFGFIASSGGGVSLLLGSNPVGWGIAGAATLVGGAYACSQKDGPKLKDLKSFARGFSIPPLLCLVVGCAVNGIDASHLLFGSSIAYAASKGKEKKEAEDPKVS
jgi:hypothetical protein